MSTRAVATKAAVDGEWTEKFVRVETTAGRALLSRILPKGLPFKAIDKALKKKEISKLIDESFRRCGLKETGNAMTKECS